MKAGTILYAGTDLGLYGNPRFTIRKTPQPEPPARATHQRVDLAVTVDLAADMPATVWARARAIQALLSTNPEGVLEIQDENGTSVSWLAQPAGNSLPDAIERGRGTVEMRFTARESADDPQGAMMTIDPLDGSPVLNIPRVESWSMNVGINRPDTFSGGRSEILSSVGFTARTHFADAGKAAALRAEELLAAAETLNALAGKEVRMIFAGFDRLVQIESFRAVPSGGWEWLDLEAQARFHSLPGSTEAEVEMRSDSEEDPASGEIRTIVSGRVRAEEKSVADAKVEAILAAWNTSNRRVTKIRKTDAWLDGEDHDSPEWIGKDFSIELSESRETASYTLRIETKEGPGDGRRITYSGTAKARTVTELLATIEQASAGKHPVTVSQQTVIEFATGKDGDEELVSGSFTHEYAAAATALFGTITLTSNRGRFEDHQNSVSGTISAPSYSAARTAARSLIPDGVILREDRETEQVAASGSGLAELASLAIQFSYGWGTAHTSTAIEYEHTTSPDYTKMTEMVEVSGVARAATAAAAKSAAQALAQALSGSTTPLRASFSDGYERDNSNTRWKALRFSFMYEQPLSGTIGHDIIEARFSLQRIGMVDHIPMTEIPLSKPVKQTAAGGGYGYNIGRLVAAGSVRARQQATARTWGQGKRAAAASVPGHPGAEDPPDERMDVNYLPFSGTTATFYEFSFQYSFRYADGLTGIWPSSGLTV